MDTASVTVMDAAERRRRFGWRHHLVNPGATPVDIAQGVVALHSSDPATVYLSLVARSEDLTPSHIESVLYEERSLVRMLGMRRTMFVVTPEFAGIMNGACTRALYPREHHKLVQMIEDQGLAADGTAWLAGIMNATLEALRRQGEATAAELKREVPELGESLTFGEGKKWGGSVGLSTRVLFLLATAGDITRAKPRGTWISSQYRWAPTDIWLGAPLPDHEPEEAGINLVTRYLGAFGPATLTDVKWWTGWTMTAARSALAGAGAVAVDLGDTVGYVLPEDTASSPQPDPWVALLPGLDSSIMGWKNREWYLGKHAADLFDRNGNAGPTIVANGRVVGGWAIGSDGDVRTHLFEPSDSQISGLLGRQAERVEAFLDGTTVTPRFRTPLEKRLLD